MENELQAAAQPVYSEQRRPVFESYKDRELARLGVPADQLPLVRGVCSAAELEQLAGRLPQEAFEALYYLSEGMTYDEVLRDLDRDRNDKPVDTADFAAALDNPDTQRRFYVVEDDLELTAIMQAPLEQWRIFLHPSQRRWSKNIGTARSECWAERNRQDGCGHAPGQMAGRECFNQEGDLFSLPLSPAILLPIFSRVLARSVRAKPCAASGSLTWIAGLAFFCKNGYDREIYYPETKIVCGMMR